MLKKISFIIIINVFLLIFIELSIKFTLNILNLPLVYKISNIDSNKYDFLTGYYNAPNQKENFSNNSYIQATDRYGFLIDGKRKPINLEKKDQNNYRIFILGGSTVQGQNLKDKFDPISARLEKKLNDRIKDNRKFFVINAGSTSFISSQETSLIQNRIIYALNPDLILVLNGTNDATQTLSKEFYLSNSHIYQRNFQRNINKNSKNLFFFIDDWFSQNISTYFLFKKIIEKTTGIYLFEKEARENYEQSSKDFNSAEKKMFRYFYNINILSKIASKKTPIIVYLQPQMLPENFNSLNKADKLIYKNHDKSNPDYFKNKQIFFDKVSKNIGDNSYPLNKNYFHIYDISGLLDKNNSGKSYYSDHVHYSSTSREIISERIYSDIFNKINLK